MIPNLTLPEPSRLSLSPSILRTESLPVEGFKAESTEILGGFPGKLSCDKKKSRSIVQEYFMGGYCDKYAE